MFRTYEPTRDRLVAVKVFRLDVVPEQAKALADELSRAAEAGLFHPSIVEPVAAGVEGTVAYRAEEYVAAESLDVAMRHYAPAALDKALPFITQLAGAIDFARAAGVGHGALHPRDIFVTPDEARATGFGVVEALERVGLRAPVRRPYSAPERIRGEAWSTPADVFSLAAIAFELLTARRPAGTGGDIGPLDGAQAGPQAPAIHAALARAMHEDPAKRFPAALAFASALEAAAHGAPEGAKGAKETGKTEEKAVLIGAAAIAASPEPDSPGLPEKLEPLAKPELAERAARPRRPRKAEPLETAGKPEPVKPVDEPADIAIERTEDESHDVLAGAAALAALPDERVEAGARREDEDAPGLFDEEAKEDLAFAERFPERYADEFVEEPPASRADPPPNLLALDDEIRDADPAVVARSSSADPRALAPVEQEVRESARPAAAPAYAPAAATVFRDVPAEPPRPAVLPAALMLVVGMLIGVAAGYAIFSGDRTAPSSTPATGTPPAPPAAGPSATEKPSGTPYTEQRVAPPQQPPSSTPPPVVTETPGPAARRPSAPAPRPAAPAETRSAPSAASRGVVTIRSTPPGAGVTINGVWRGRTPLKLDALPFGAYAVRLVQPGYTVAREEFTLSASSPSRTMTVTLRPASGSAATPSRGASPPPGAQEGVGSGSIYVDSRPRGARVFVDGRDVGETPLRLGDVTAGSHTVRLELADHRTWTSSRYVLAGQETRVTGSLERIR